MKRATDPRQLAELCRRLANVRTSGGHNIDRVLHTLADKLDHEAARAQPPAAGQHHTASREPKRR